MTDEVLNKSGCKPFGIGVLLRMRTEPKEIKSRGGIITATESGIGDQSWERRQMNVVVGQIVALGSRAFYDAGTDAPKVGDWILVRRHAGVHIAGDDGEAYRSIKDIEIHTITNGNEERETIG